MLWISIDSKPIDEEGYVNLAFERTGKRWRVTDCTVVNGEPTSGIGIVEWDSRIHGASHEITHWERVGSDARWSRSCDKPDLIGATVDV